MERAGAEDMPENAERKGLGTPATRAAILEKLVQMGFVQRKGKQLVPTKDGINLAVVLLVRVGAIRVQQGILTQGLVIALYNYMSQILIELIKMANLIVTIAKDRKSVV